MGLIISVSGIRGIVGQDLTVADAMRFGMLFGQALGNDDKPVILAGDSRISGDALRSAVSAGLMAVGRDVIDLGVVTTPGACLMVRKLQAAGGAVVTASHNPIEWNGIKMIGADGLSFDSRRAKQIKERFNSGQIEHKSAKECGHITRNDETHKTHIETVLNACDNELIEKIRSRRFKVVLDSVNGAGCVGTAGLIEKFNCELIHINNQPTGDFAHTPEPIAENLVELADKVGQLGADVGFAQDPDADRLALVDEKGRFIGEEYTVVLASWFVLKRSAGSVAVNLSTSRMIDDLAERFGQKVIRTAVGETNVAKAVLANNCPIGGEGNGGVIYPKVVPVRDSFSGIALILELMAETGKTISELVDELPKYVMIKKKFPCNLNEAPQRIEKLISKYEKEQISTIDGLRIDWPEKKAWVHIRPSNTEPIIRIIGEAPERELAEELIAKLAADAGL